jgi:predicted enzyme involved in methoxymalonyl-ACP biosynthesis
LNAKKNGASTLTGEYIPTPRNVIVKDHYKKLGFTKISTNKESETWSLDIKRYKSPNSSITVSTSI